MCWLYADRVLTACRPRVEPMPCCSGHAHAHNHTNTTGYYEDMDTEWGPLSYEPFAEPGVCGMLLVLLVLLTPTVLLVLLVC